MPVKNKLPSQKYLLSLFSYNKRTGELRWRVAKSRRVHPGDLIDGQDGSGHIQVIVDGVTYHAHRIIWKMVTGRDPKCQIDHDNRVPNDNCWRNLREANLSQQKMNGNLYKNNKSGERGVYGKPGSWVVYIRKNWKLIRVGRYTEFEDARRARRTAAKQLFGEFAP